MIADRLARVALLAYPRGVRESRGGEMLGTVLDVSEGSPWRLLVETLVLIRSGLRARASLTAGSGSRRVVATACAQGATVWGLVLLIAYFQLDRMILGSSGVAQGEGGLFFTQWVTGEVGLFLTQALIAVSVTAALVGYDRTAALWGLAWIGVSLHTDLSASFAGWDRAGHVIALLLVPAACYVAMLLKPRARHRDARRLLWLAAGALVGLAPSPALTNFGYGVLGVSGIVLLALLVAGLLLLPAGSSLPLAFALALLAYGLSLWTLPAGVPPIDASAVRRAMTTLGPMLLVVGATLRLASARRCLAG